jgi:hypothetical protein
VQVAFISYNSLKGIPPNAELRITKHTELGDNSTIKNPENMVEMPRRQRRKEKGVAFEE